MNVRLKIGQRLFAAFAFGLRFEEENGQRTEQGQIARRRRVAHGAAVLVLGTVPAIVLTIFNTPMVADQFQQWRRPSLLRPVGGHGESDLVGFFDYLALAHRLNVAIDADDLGYSRQADGLWGGGLAL